LRCFGRDSRGAFTLLELLVVIAIVGLIAGVTVPAAARLLAGSNPRESLREVRAELAMARAEALRAAEGVEATVTLAERSLRVSYLEHEREVAARWLDPSGGGEEAAQGVMFDPMGLASRKELVFSDARRDPGTIWLIPFDPVSGRPGDPRTREEQPR
jgi:prepilin-type N-terminal cleavage/methylation domain-containing protein